MGVGWIGRYGFVVVKMEGSERRHLESATDKGLNICVVADDILREKEREREGFRGKKKEG